MKFDFKVKLPKELKEFYENTKYSEIIVIYTHEKKINIRVMFDTKIYKFENGKFNADDFIKWVKNL